MNNSTRYKDHPQQQALEERMGGKAKLLVWFVFFYHHHHQLYLWTRDPFSLAQRKNNRS
jgi:hypothetical protein